MTTTATLGGIFVTGACLYFALVLGATELARANWLRELRALTLRERNRNRFGAIRTRLLELSGEGKVDVKGPWFAWLYRSLTLLMRKPEEYETAANAILMVPDEARPRAKGKVKIPEVEAQILLEYARGLDQLCRDYSKVYRFFAFSHDLSMQRKAMQDGRAFDPERFAPLWVKWHVFGVTKTMESMRPVFKAKKTLETMAGTECPA
jgi:hypothetical protein